MCPKCKTINPKTKIETSEFHLTERCKSLTGIKRFFGLIPIKIYCNSINIWDSCLEKNIDNRWILLDK